MQLPTSSHTKSPPAPEGAFRGERPSLFPAGAMLPFLLTTIIFFLWGMSNNLTDILVQQFRKSFELNLIQAQLVQTAVFLAYATMAIPAALLMRRFGYKSGLLVGLIVFGVGTLLFWPAAVIGQYAPFLIALFVVGCGSSILETSANPLMARFGPAATAGQRLNFAQAFNPPGTITGVLIGTWFIFSGVDKSPAEVTTMKAAGTYTAYLHTEILRVVPTYVVLGAAVLVLATLIWLTRFPVILDSNADQGIVAEELDQNLLSSIARLLRNPHLSLAVVAQFFYVGAQIGTWSTYIPYLKAYTPMGERTAGYFLTATLIALAIGRIVSTSLMRYIAPEKMMGAYAAINVVLVAIGVAAPGMAGGYAILFSSFFMSIMYPTIFAMGVRDLGEDTKLGGSLLVMAIAGGAIFPPAMGWIARATGSVAMGYLLPAAGYVVVALYAFLASRMGPGRLTHGTPALH
jgi:FHS family L-fucose permease-like MFS transporter